jgi:hypothetical protein
VTKVSPGANEDLTRSDRLRVRGFIATLGRVLVIVSSHANFAAGPQCQRLRPLVLGKEFVQRRRAFKAEHDLRGKVGGVDLVDEFSALDRAPTCSRFAAFDRP